MEQSKLKREIGVLGASFIALNGIVGAGIFAMPQALVDNAGAASPYLIVAFGAPMILIALAFGALAARSEVTGGPVAYANAALGRSAGFGVGWLYYLARLASTAANTNAFLTYFAVFAPGADQGIVRLLAIVVMVASLTALNIVGIKGAVRTLSFVTLLKLLPLLALVVGGLIVFWPSIPAPQAPADAAAVSGVSLLLLYAFVGFEMATLTAGETRDARRTLPWALVGTILAMTLLYFLVQLAYVAIMQGKTPEGAPLAAAADALVGKWGALAMAAAALVSIGGNLLASSIVTPRLTFAMADEGTLPRWLAAVHARFGTPANSILMFGIIAGVLAASSAFVWLAAMAALARMFVYLVCMGALLKQLKSEGGARLMAYVASILGALLCLWAVAQAKPDAWIFLAAFAALGAAIYALTRWRMSAPP